MPVDKQASKIEEEEVPIGDRTNMLFSSSLITYGRGKAIDVETGMNTEVGKIANIINSAEEGETSLSPSYRCSSASAEISSAVPSISVSTRSSQPPSAAFPTCV